MLGAWIAAVIVSIGLGVTVGGDFNSTPAAPDSESTDGFSILQEHFPGQSSELAGQIVFKADQGVTDPAVQTAMRALLAELDAEDDITIIDPYGPAGAQQISADGTVAFATANFAPDTESTRGSLLLMEDEMAGLVDAARAIPGLEVEFGGEVFAVFAPPESELLGLAFAIVVLIAAFGSVLAMGLPIAVALAGVGTGAGLILLLTRFLATPEFAPVLGAMIGLGVGIDYALFVVTRYREELHEGTSFEEANRIAFGTAGRAVIFAGITVVISLLGMMVMGLPFVSALGISTAATVLVTMLASVTLLPAFLGFAGDRIEVTRRRGLLAAGLVAVGLFLIGLHFGAIGLIPIALAVVVLIAGTTFEPLKKIVPRRREKPLHETIWYRWSRWVQHNPWPAAILGAGILLVLSVPLLSLRLGFSDTGNFPEESTTRKAYDLTVDGFGPGFNGPILLATEVTGPQDLGTLGGLTELLQNEPGIEAVVGPIPNSATSPAAALIQVVPASGPQDQETVELVERLRNNLIPAITTGTDLDVKVTGIVPVQVDFTDYLSGRLPIFFLAVLGLSFLLLMAVFRSLLVPLKAVLMNLLSISAAYGLLVALFQWGWGADILGVTGGAPIEPFLPMMLFAIVFGLSMDYEVFLISRIKEDYDQTGDSMESVANGLAATARVISAAAAIMVVVFGAFLLEENRIVKMFGIGLASAIFLDATLVRMLLVPATMELLGDRNWWLPKWLDKILPRINIEG